MKYEEPKVVIPELERHVGTGVRREWTPRDEKTLKTYYGKVPPRALAKVLGRTMSAIRNKAAMIR